MSLPEVSVVVPTRNRAPLLRLTLSSVLAQHEVDLEVVVVDEASSDETPAVAAAIDPRVRCLRNAEPQGVATARNQGIEASGGRWVALLDDDDLFAPDKLRTQLDAAAAANAPWAYGGAVGIDEDLVVRRTYPAPPVEQLLADLPLRNPVPAGASNVLVRRDLLDEVGMFDPDLRHMADWDLWRRLGRAAAPARVDAPVVAYRFHTANASLDTPGILAEAELLEQRYGNPIDWATVHWWIADSSLRAGRRRQAARHYLRAARHGSSRNVVRAFGALLLPFVDRGVSHNPLHRRRAPDPWARDAAEWIAAVGAPR